MDFNIIIHQYAATHTRCARHLYTEGHLSYCAVLIHINLGGHITSEKVLPRVEIEKDQCKGCELCVLECPKDVLVMSDVINQLGYPIAKFTGEGCTGCAICFYACPEPGNYNSL